MNKLNYPWAVIVTNTLDDEVECKVYKTWDKAYTAVVEDIMNEKNIRDNDNVPATVDTSMLTEQNYATLTIHLEDPYSGGNYHYAWSIIHIEEPED